MFEKLIKAIGIILALVIIGTIIFFAAVIISFSKSNKRLDKERAERRTKLLEEFHRDMQQRFGLGPEGYTIVHEFFERGSSYSVINFQIKGEGIVRKVKYEYQKGWMFQGMGYYSSILTPTPTPAEVPRNLKGLQVTILKPTGENRLIWKERMI